MRGTRMSRRRALAAGGAVAMLAAGIGAAAVVRARGSVAEDPAAESTEGHPIVTELEAVNQDGTVVRLSELRGKVWVAAEFFARCPQCARRNAADLQALRERFGDRSDFHIVCLSIDPEHDDVARLAAYAAALRADSDRWWFLTGERAAIHRFSREALRFQPLAERTDPDEIAALGKYRHDLGIVVVNRAMEVIGKRDLAWASEQGPELHAAWQEHLHGIIARELARSAL